MHPTSLQILKMTNVILDREESNENNHIKHSLPCSVLSKWAAGSLCLAYRKQEVAVCKEQRFNVIGL